MSLKIIAGKFKGRILNVPKGNAVRPTTGRVRQRIFDTLQDLWPGSHGVDAFAGSGAIGFEALSRGAAHVLVCERDASHARLIQNNQRLLGVEDSAYSLQVRPFEQWLKNTPDETLSSVDWLFFDPPYGYKGLETLLSQLIPRLNSGTWLIVEHGTSKAELAALQTLEQTHVEQCSCYKHIACGDSDVRIFMII